MLLEREKQLNSQYKFQVKNKIGTNKVRLRLTNQ